MNKKNRWQGGVEAHEPFDYPFILSDCTLYCPPKHFSLANIVRFPEHSLRALDGFY